MQTGVHNFIDGTKRDVTILHLGLKWNFLIFHNFPNILLTAIVLPNLTEI